MALFVLHNTDKPNSLELRMATRAAHLAYAADFGDRIKLGGPLLDENGDMAGSLIIIDVDSIDEARKFSAGDPYAKAGLFGQIQITPFRMTLQNLA